MAEAGERRVQTAGALGRDDDVERLRGKAMERIFNQLVEDKTVLRVFLLGKDYERLTIVTDFREEDEERFLVVDHPSGFTNVAARAEPWKLRFEFTGRDRLPYVFRTTGGEVAPEGLILPAPKFVERRQRRRSFRLEPPLGTKLYIGPEEEEIEAVVYNISVGGAFISLEREKERKPLLALDQKLRPLRIIFPDKEGPVRVNIKEAIVKRLERDLFSHQYKYALQFTQISKEDINLLERLIFKYQREYLRKSRLLDS